MDTIRIFTQYKACATTMMRLGPGPFYCATEALVLRTKESHGIRLAEVIPLHDPTSKQLRCVEMTTGAIVGPSMEDVLVDIKEAVSRKGGLELMKKQIEDAGPMSRVADDVPSERFWNAMR